MVQNTHVLPLKTRGVHYALLHLPGKVDIYAPFVYFSSIFTTFWARQKTTVKHDVFEGCGDHVGNPRFFAISIGKKHSPPPLQLAGWVAGGLGGWVAGLGWLGGWVAGLGWLVGWLAGMG